MKYYAIGLAALMALSGCTALEAATGSVSSVAPQAMIDAEKALTAAHSLHEAAADAATISAQTKLCVGTCATKAKVYLDQSETYLVAADKLVALGDAVGIESKVSGAIALISQIESLAIVGGK